MSALRTLVLLAACTAFTALAALACSDADAGDAPVGGEVDAASADDASAGTGSSAGDAGGSGASSSSLEVTGNFELTLVPEVLATADRPAAAAFAKMLGQALDGMTPESPVWTMIAEEGDCQLFEPSLPFCNPGCGADVCIAGGVCAGYPRGLDLGAVTLRGVRTDQGGDRVVMKPVPPKYSYQLPGSPHLEYPPFAPDDEVTLDVEGGAVPAFAISARGITPLELIGDGPIAFSADAAAEVRWEPAPSEDSHIRIVVDLSHHGGRKGELRCESADTGALDIPASLGAQLLELGLAGNPTLEVSRVSSGAVAVAAGRVALTLSSPVKRALDIPGLISCMEPGMQSVCPDGQLCQPEHRCR